MKLLILKYQSKLSGIFLAIYLYHFIAGIFHYHNFDFSNTDIVDSGKDNLFLIISKLLLEIIMIA